MVEIIKFRITGGPEIYISCERKEDGSYVCNDVKWKEGGVERRLGDPPLIIQPSPEGKFIITRTGGAPIEIIDKVIEHFNRRRV